MKSTKEKFTKQDLRKKRQARINAKERITSILLIEFTASIFLCIWFYAQLQLALRMPTFSLNFRNWFPWATTVVFLCLYYLIKKSEKRQKSLWWKTCQFSMLALTCFYLLLNTFIYANRLPYEKFPESVTYFLKTILGFGNEQQTIYRILILIPIILIVLSVKCFIDYNNISKKVR